MFYHYWWLKISETLTLFTKFYLPNKNIISLNKNLVLSGIVGIVISLFVAYYSDSYSADEFLNSALTVLIGFISSKIIFVTLFHLDHKKKYTKRFSGKLNLGILRQVLMKMIFADSIFDIINNVSRFYQPIQAALIASIVASALSYLAINLIVRRIHVFGEKKKIL